MRIHKRQVLFDQVKDVSKLQTYVDHFLKESVKTRLKCLFYYLPQPTSIYKHFYYLTRSKMCPNLCIPFFLKESVKTRLKYVFFII
jgi:hypothetical protein